MTIRERLFALRDEKYAAFHSKLIPTVPPESIIGVRVPDVRKLAKELMKEGNYSAFLNELPHKYYDENMLHGFLISEMKNYDECIRETERFLPFVDNWAVCDTMSPKVFKKNKEQLIIKIREWASSNETYICRFGIGMLMSHFLDGDFRAEYLEIPASVHSEEYYVNMMIAWFFATALSKQWDAVIPYIENGVLDVWVHNKTIQKARKSYRITDGQKQLLKAMKR